MGLKQILCQKNIKKLYLVIVINNNNISIPKMWLMVIGNNLLIKHIMYVNHTIPGGWEFMGHEKLIAKHF